MYFFARIFFFSLLFFTGIGQSNVAINVSGFSYHFSRVTDDGKVFNEFNFGLGTRLIFKDTVKKSYWFSEIGYYRDSGSFNAIYTAIGYQRNVLFGFFVGFNFSIMNSENINEGKWLFAPIPMVSYQYSFFILNVVYIPKLSGVNAYDALGFYFSIVIN